MLSLLLYRQLARLLGLKHFWTVIFIRGNKQLLTNMSDDLQIGTGNMEREFDEDGKF